MSSALFLLMFTNPNYFKSTSFFKHAGPDNAITFGVISSHKLKDIWHFKKEKL